MWLLWETDYDYQNWDSAAKRAKDREGGRGSLEVYNRGHEDRTNVITIPFTMIKHIYVSLFKIKRGLMCEHTHWAEVIINDEMKKEEN